MDLFTNTSAPIIPLKEILAYEALWAEKNTSFKSITSLFKSNPGARPSDLIGDEKIREVSRSIKNIILGANINLLMNGTFDFPKRLRDAKEPVELLYYSGYIDFLETRCFTIVGTREPSKKGLDITSEITKRLVEDNFTIVSGLAKGIDTQAHTTALNNRGRTIGVLGTPINKSYPKENSTLQKEIAENHLLISQVPFYIHLHGHFQQKKSFFLERNKTMSALSEATLIVEAGETSGSLTQAKAALEQGRKLFIWEDCIKNKEITWPKRFLSGGAIPVGSYEDIYKELKTT